MDPTDSSVPPNTEYRQNYTWNKIVSQNIPNVEEPISQTEYKRAFAWPQSARRVSPKDIEPPIVGHRVVPGQAVAVPVEPSAKKSVTISNFADVVGKPDVLFSKEPQPVSTNIKINKKSEYHSKFRPFSAYVYVSGNGFKKPKNLDQFDEVDKVKNWYSEVEERSKQANQYKTRSQLGHPLASEGLTQIYSQGSLWNNYHVDRGLQALALATTQKIIEEKRQERNVRALTSPPKSGQTRLLNSAPPSLRTELPISCHQSVRTKSPMYRPPSADKHSKNSSISESPKPEGKIWLKPKPKTQEANPEKKVAPNPVPKELPKELPKDVAKSPNSGDGGPKSPRPTTLGGSNGIGKNGTESVNAPIPPLPSGPIRTTQVKSPEEITGVKSPSPESWTVPIDKGLNWMNGETPHNIDSKYSADMSAIKPTPISAKTREAKDVSEGDRSKTSATKAIASTHSKPTALVQPSPTTSLSSISNPGSKYTQSIDEEVKIVRPANARQKATNVLDKARSRLDNFWTRNK